MGFGLIVFFDEPEFFILALVFRSLQGGANAAIYTTAYSIFSMMYEGHDIMHINSYFKLTIGIGLLIGYIVGTLLYMLGGYPLPFILFSIMFICFIPIVAEHFPKSMKDETSKIKIVKI